ncbi:NUDIX hydrolase [Corynebacterium uterequi]|uniref:NUDIX family protein n=1 Tax=Corynebacterium uterequi TaxID=1072256 RepID=A0A0G3HDV9_9CORY|nr:NUDIX hydrolase [Corynebacterium uterequi]AKK10910.1 NUDIX family protein [Corynebacterium uterequi]
MASGALSSDAGDRIDHTDLTGYHGGRLAATVILLRDGATGLEVWVQERVTTMPNYPGVTVFPGGGVDQRDFPARSWDSGSLWSGPSVVSLARRLGTTKYKAHALMFAAVRELYEEAGTLLVTDAAGDLLSDASELHEEREMLITHRRSLTEVLQRHHLRVRSDLLLPSARWVGQSENGTWFDTFSFVSRLPVGQSPDGFTSEADDANWFSPQLLIDGWRAGLVRLVLPTWAQLSQLTRYDSVDEVLAAARNADLNPVIGEPVEPDYHEFFAHTPEDRIGNYRGFYSR